MNSMVQSKVSFRIHLPWSQPHSKDVEERKCSPRKLKPTLTLGTRGKRASMVSWSAIRLVLSSTNSSFMYQTVLVTEGERKRSLTSWRTRARPLKIVMAEKHAVTSFCRFSRNQTPLPVLLPNPPPSISVTPLHQGADFGYSRITFIL